MLSRSHPHRSPGWPLAWLMPGILLLPALGCQEGETTITPPPAPAAAPAIREVVPAQAHAYDEISISGTGLGGTRQVRVAGYEARGVQVVSDTLVRAIVPLASGTGPVTVSGEGGMAASRDPFRILPAPPTPVISAFTPPQGPPGTLITLDGTGFQGARSVTFHGIPAAFSVVSDARITATVPAGFQEGAIALVMPARVSATASGTFRATVPAPAIFGFLPASGPAGTRIYVQGDQFRNVHSVTLGGRPIPSFTVEGPVLTFEVPANGLTGPIAVVDGAGVTVSTAPAVFTVETPGPSAASFTPASGPVGTWVTVSGAFLGQVTGATVGGVDVEVMEPASADGGTLRLRVPPGALPGPLVLQSAAGAIQVPGGPFTVTTPLLRADSFSPVQGLEGTEITVLGANLDQVQLVDFGGATAAPAHVTGDRLTVNVPAGAATGPLRLLTAGGDIQVPGSAFTVLSPAPVLASFSPAGGPPGTEVTLAGQHLGAFTALRYGNLTIPADQVDRVDGSLRLRLPDGITQSDLITVITPGGTAQTAAPFQLTPSRITALNQAVVRTETVFTGTNLDFPQARRTDQYRLDLPQAPVLHTYTPGNNGQLRGDRILPAYPLSFLLPAAFYPALPRSIRDQVATLGLDPARVDILVSGQDYPYTGAFAANAQVDWDRTYLFRPHYWTDPDAPYWGIYNQARQVRGGFFEADPALRLSGTAPGGLLTFGISVHGPGATTAGMILSSGPTEPIQGLDVTQTTAFWSLVVMGDRAAATLHMLLADPHVDLLQQLAPTLHTLGDVFAAGNGLADTRAFQMLRALGRPLVEEIRIQDVPEGRVATLRGTGMAGALAVRMGEVPLPFTPLGDTVVRATLPADAAGALTVTTRLGASDPVPLP